MGHWSTGHVERAYDICLDDVEPCFRIGSVDRRHAGDAGIVHNDIDFAETIDNPANTRIDTLLISNVHRYCKRPVLRKILDRGSRAKRYACAILVKLFGNGEAD